MKREDIKLEILNTLQSYEASGLIDDTSLNNWIKTCLKQFGGNLMVEEEITIKVENGKVKLPDNFYSLTLAMRCEPAGYSTECKEDKKHIQSEFFYKERIEKSEFFDNQAEREFIKIGEDVKTITESVYFIDQAKNNRSINYHYSNLCVLKLKRGYKKQKCDTGCPNLHIQDSLYEISIFNNNYIDCNFEDGYVYLRYRGLAEEDGDLLIPETQRDSLQYYIQYHCIRKVLETLWVNNDDMNVINKIQYFRQLERENFAAAKNEIINEGMSGWAKTVKRRNKIRRRKFDVMYRPI